MSLLKSIAFVFKKIFGGYMLFGQRLRFPGALFLACMISVFIWELVELSLNLSQPWSLMDWVMGLLFILVILPSLGMLLAGWVWKVLGWSLPKTSSVIIEPRQFFAQSWLSTLVLLFNIGGLLVVTFMVLAATFWLLLLVLGKDA